MTGSPASRSPAGVPTVSVIVPFLDPPTAFFREALDGVHAQTWTDWELILVDDGSGPAARRLADLAASDSSRTRVVESGPKRPVGISGARNAGLRQARGELVAMLDSDDVWLPGHLARHVAALEDEPRAAMVCTDALYWASWREGSSPDDDFVPLSEAPAGLFEPPGFAVDLIAGRVPVPCPVSVTARRSVVEQIGGFEASWATERSINSMYEDQVFYVKLGSRQPVLRLPVVLEHYRLHRDSVTGAASEDAAREARRQFLDWCEDSCTAALEPGPAHRLRRTVRKARWRHRHPRLAAGWRRGRKLIGRGRRPR